MAQATTISTYRWTLDAYRIAWEAGAFGDANLELIDGELYTVPPASPGHDWLIELLHQFLEAKLAGKPVRVREEKTVFINESSTPKPDISVVPNRNYSEAHPCPADVHLVVEVANSHPERDLELKRDVYAEAGITQYWVFDLKQKTFRVYTNPVSGVYQEAIIWNDTVALLGIDIPVKELLDLAFKTWSS